MMAAGSPEGDGESARSPEGDRKREQFMQVTVGHGVYEMVFEFGQPSGATLPFTARTIHRDLLWTARRLADQDELQAAVVLAQTASEVQVERAIAALLRLRGVDDHLHEAVTGLIPNYNLHPGNTRLQKLWRALSGDSSLEAQEIWPRRVQAHVERRNGVAHRGQLLMKPERTNRSGPYLR